MNNKHSQHKNQPKRNQNKQVSHRSKKYHRSPEPEKLSSVVLQECLGILELHHRGYGFLRSPTQLARRNDDVFVPESLVSQFQLRQGVQIKGLCHADRKRNDCRLVQLTEVEGVDPLAQVDLLPFEEQTPVNPRQWLRLERPDEPNAMGVLDLLCPVARGQRALIASPPRAGKTTLLKQIGQSISANYPDIQLMALLIDERPEEVTELRAELNGQVYASCLDQDIQSHVRLSNLVIDRCKRLAESGKHVFLLVDSLTRMARAFNKLPHLSGPVGAGGLNIRALDIPKQVFASARSFKNAGSLTIVATVLIETENRMDEVIFQEFKGTGNLDLVLNQHIAEQRVWPAIDIPKSGTRRAELIHDSQTLNAVTALRRTLLTMAPHKAIRELTTQLNRFQTNDEFVNLINGTLAINN